MIEPYRREEIAATCDRLRRQLKMYEMFEVLDRPKDAIKALAAARDYTCDLESLINDERNRYGQMDLR